MEPEILYEDNHIIAINKQVSDIIQGDKTGDLPLSEKVKEYIKKKYNKPGNVFLGVTHRLDRPASGVILFAKTGKALTRLNKLFKENEVRKKYWAIVKNKPKKNSDTLVDYLVKNNKTNKSFVSKGKKGKKAELYYETKHSSDNYYLIEIKLKTGRSHQIRCQLTNIGSPIKGDLKYGFPRSNKNSGINLHARNIEFIHPVSKKQINITAPIPGDDNLWKYFEKLSENE